MSTPTPRSVFEWWWVLGGAVLGGLLGMFVPAIGPTLMAVIGLFAGLAVALVRMSRSWNPRRGDAHPAPRHRHGHH